MTTRGIAVGAMLLGGVLAIVVPVYFHQTTTAQPPPAPPAEPLPLPAEPLPALPVEAVWRVRYDVVLDGEIRGDAGLLNLRLTIHNKRVHGVPAATHKDDLWADHRVSGELTDGSVQVLFLRQDGPKNYTGYYTARRVNEGRFLGTWIDNQGSSGDFDMVQLKQ
jgi:hypothetical protein